MMQHRHYVPACAALSHAVTEGPTETANWTLTGPTPFRQDRGAACDMLPHLRLYVLLYNPILRPDLHLACRGRAHALS